MKTDRTALAFTLLFYVLLLVAAGTAAFFGMQRLREVREQIRSAEATLQARQHQVLQEKLLREQKTALTAALAQEQERYYAKAELSEQAFTAQVRMLLETHALQVERLQATETTDTAMVECTLNGEAPALLSFLQAVSLQQRYWEMPYVAITRQSPDGTVTVVLRIGYGQIE